MKVFFDTNVLIAAFATRGLCSDLFVHVLLEHELIVGEVVLDELREKLLPIVNPRGLWELLRSGSR